MSTPVSNWTTHELGAVEPATVVEALASPGEVPLAAGLMSAIAEDLDMLVTVAADGAVVDADVLGRLAVRCRIAAELASRKGQENPP